MYIYIYMYLYLLARKERADPTFMDGALDSLCRHQRLEMDPRKGDDRKADGLNARLEELRLMR